MDRGDEFWRDSALTRRFERARGHGNRDPKLAAVDFGSEKRPRNGYIALSLSRRTRRRRDASLQLRPRATQDFSISATSRARFCHAGPL